MCLTVNVTGVQRFNTSSILEKVNFVWTWKNCKQLKPRLWLLMKTTPSFVHGPEYQGRTILYTMYRRITAVQQMHWLQWCDALTVLVHLNILAAAFGSRMNPNTPVCELLHGD